MSRKAAGKFSTHFRNLTLYRKFSKLSYLHNVGTEPLRPLTLGQLLEQISSDYGERPAIISRHQNKQINFREVLYQADRLAAGFYKLGFSRGDCVGLISPNYLEWYVSAMAFARAGFLLAPINPAYQSHEIEYCINKINIKGLIIADKFKSQNYYELINKICKELPTSQPGDIKSANLPYLKNVVVLSEEYFSGCYRYSDVLNMANEENVELVKKVQGKIRIDETCNVQFTSGTTGKSKVAAISHFSLVNNGYYIGKRNEMNQKHHKICCPNPLFHAFGTVIAISSALNHACTLVLPDAGYDPGKTLDAIKEENCSIIYGTPTMFIDLITIQKERQEQLNAEIALTGGAPCSPQVFHDMQNILGVKKMKSVYGLSETTASAFHSMPSEGEYEATSTVGYLQEHLEAKVVDSNNNIVPRGVPGELCIRGYSVMLEYMNDPEKTREIIGNDRWLHTGDQFIINENGYGKVVGRIKEMLVRGGENIYPKEIEDFLHTHPDILEAQVIGLPHERLGEEVCACLRLRDKGITFTLDDLKQYCKGKIAHFKIPSVLKIRSSFPTTSSGKIQKFKLKEEILSESRK